MTAVGRVSSLNFDRQSLRAGVGHLSFMYVRDKYYGAVRTIILWCMLQTGTTSGKLPK
jgi:hypothetical protein